MAKNDREWMGRKSMCSFHALFWLSPGGTIGLLQLRRCRTTSDPSFTRHPMSPARCECRFGLLLLLLIWTLLPKLDASDELFPKSFHWRVSFLSWKIFKTRIDTKGHSPEITRRWVAQKSLAGVLVYS